MKHKMTDSVRSICMKWEDHLEHEDEQPIACFDCGEWIDGYYDSFTCSVCFSQLCSKCYESKDVIDSVGAWCIRCEAEANA